MKRFLAALLCLIAAISLVFLIGCHGWRLGGFHACQSAGIEAIQVEENQVRIRGFYPGSFPQGFQGYHAEQVADTLYVGFRFSGLFGLFQTGDFDIVIPTQGTVTQVVMQTKNSTYPVWPGEYDALPGEGEAGDAGIYVQLQRSDVFRIEWDFLGETGGIKQANGHPLGTTEAIYLDNAIYQTAVNQAQAVPVKLTFLGETGDVIAQGTVNYDPHTPLLTVTLTAKGSLTVNPNQEP